MFLSTKVRKNKTDGEYQETPSAIQSMRSNLSE